jgi:hypothetical protein
MAEFSRDEMEEMVNRWLAVNEQCEANGDWGPMADMYREDATYLWNVGPKGEFCANGREEIREYALGTEMSGLEGWTYPYQEILIDEKKGQVIGLWRQVADATRPDGSHYEVAGIGGSWFKYGGDLQWAWQRDWFDMGNAAAVFFEMMNVDALSEGMKERMSGQQMPGHYKAGTAADTLWPKDIGWERS